MTEQDPPTYTEATEAAGSSTQATQNSKNGSLIVYTFQYRNTGEEVTTEERKCEPGEAKQVTIKVTNYDGDYLRERDNTIGDLSDPKAVSAATKQRLKRVGLLIDRYENLCAGSDGNKGADGTDNLGKWETGGTSPRRV